MKVWILAGLSVIGLFVCAPTANAITLDDVTYYEQQLKSEQAEKAEEARNLAEQELVKRAEALVGTRGGSCVDFAKDFKGVPRRIRWTKDGLARTIRVDTHTPVVGALILTRESGSGHVGLVLPPTREGYTRILDSNYKKNTVTIREIPTSSPIIRGYNTTY